MKAIVKDGTIQPQEPLPADWLEGTELDVEKAALCHEQESLDQWYAKMEAIASEADPEEDARLGQAIQEIRQSERELARKQAGLPE